MPPPIDLSAFGTIGLLELSAPLGSDLGRRAASELMAGIHAAQPGTPILEIHDHGPYAPPLAPAVLDPDALRAIGKRHHVDTLLVGEIASQTVRPGFRVGDDASSISASADLDGTMTLRMYDTRSGATLWTTAVSACAPLARVALADGDLSGLGMSDPRGAEQHLLQDLVARSTRDFWPYWVRQ